MKDGAVHIKNLVKTYLDEHGNPSFTAVKNINLEIPDGEFMVLVGPSGCGKSTTLRMLAGLENITSGTIAIGDRVVNNVHPKDRGIAMVFQNYALYPHMTIFDNIGFGLKLAKKPKDFIQKKVTKPRAASDSTKCWTASLGRFPEASAKEWPSGERSCGIPKYSSLTSRFPILTRRCGCTCVRRSRDCTPN